VGSTGAYDAKVAYYSGVDGTDLTVGILGGSGIFGGSGSDMANGVAADGLGNLVMTGYTLGGTFNGTTLTTAGGLDTFLMKLAP
jgi:hypothetical protein